MNNIKIKYYFLMLILLVSADQLIKYLIRQNGGFYICNNGISFGITIPQIIIWLFGISTLIVLLGFFYDKFKSLKINKFYLIILSGGIIGNLIDRFYWGCVIDYIDFKIWPVFNLADIFISIGAIMIITKYLKHKK